MPRSYNQFCALAHAMDALGERWTVLIVRELLLGPRRYGELLDALPGIGTNLLADRLATMASQEICRREDRLYALTDRGRSLEPAVLALASWGMSPMAAPAPDEHMRPDWYALAMAAAFRADRALSEAEAYEFEIEGELFHLRSADGSASARRGPADRPAFRLTTDLPTFLGIATKTAEPPGGSVSGDRRAVKRWLAAFALPLPVG